MSVMVNISRLWRRLWGAIMGIDTRADRLPHEVRTEGYVLPRGALGLVALTRLTGGDRTWARGHMAYTTLDNAVTRWGGYLEEIYPGQRVMAVDHVATENGPVMVIMTDSGQLGYVPLSTESNDFHGISVVRRVT